MSDDKSEWLTSKTVAEFLIGRRDNDIKCNVDGIYVPIRGVRYDGRADTIVLDLYEGDDWKAAMAGADAPDDGTP